MTTKEAFEKLTSERAWYKGLGFERVTASSYVNRFKEGKLSIEKMEEILEKAGYVVVVEKKWAKN